MPQHQARHRTRPEDSLAGLRVALYAGMFVRDYDGATKTLYKLVDSLLRRRAQVGVWTYSSSPDRLPGVSVFTVPAIPFPFYPDYKFALPGPKLVRQMEAFKPGLIHLTVPDAVGMGLLGYAKLKRIPVLISYHTDFVSYLDERNLWYLSRPWRPILRWFYGRADSLLVPSQDSVAKFARQKIRAAVWGRGLAKESFNTSFRSGALRRRWGAEGKKVILYSGQLAWFKDMLVCVQVYRMFQRREGPRPVFVLIGRGPLEAELKKDMPEAVFLGYLGGKDLSAAYASADILLFPSTTETFGNVIQEAIASGLPAVVSDRGGCQEIVRKTGGGLVARAKDAGSFFRCCSKLLTEKAFYRRVREAGLANIKNRDWESINRVVLKEYVRLTSRRFS
ncbi:MAG: glycosyltransferase family 1 protein [Candidatus Aminicenantales bacterium]